MSRYTFGLVLAAVGLLITFAVFLLQEKGWFSQKEDYLVSWICGTFMIAPGFDFIDLEPVRWLWNAISLLCFLAWLMLDDDDDPRNKRKRLRSKIKSHIPRPRIVAVRPIQQGA